MSVTGVGGFFFRAKDPTALAAWYLAHLGVGAPPGHFVWPQQAGPTVFQPFRDGSDYFAPDRRWMTNFRVQGLDALLDRLRAAGVEVRTDPAWDSPQVGRFARIHDPEGNPIELWEPAPAPDGAA